MESFLNIITNACLKEDELDKNCKLVVKKLRKLNLTPIWNSENNHQMMENVGDWEYYVIKNTQPSFVEFDSPFEICFSTYQNITVMSTVIKYKTIYEDASKDFFQNFRKNVYAILKIIGGTEAILLNSNPEHKFNFYLNLAHQNKSYDFIKKLMIDEFGLPKTTYSQLSKSPKERTREFFLDDFSDLKSKELQAHLPFL